MSLSIERLREVIAYDPITGALTAKTCRSRVKVGDRVERKMNAGYFVVNLFNVRHLAHRLVWFYVNGSWPDGEIDHIDGDKTNNRISNLRNVTRQVNMQNVSMPRANNGSGFLGVSFDKRTGRWVAQIRIRDGAKINLGRYNTPTEAHRVYVAAKRQFHEGNML